MLTCVVKFELEDNKGRNTIDLVRTVSMNSKVKSRKTIHSWVATVLTSKQVPLDVNEVLSKISQ